MPIELTQLPVLVMTVASVVLPFMYAVPRDPGERFVTIAPRAERRKQRLLAVLLLAVLVVGLYAMVRYRPISLWYLIVAPLVLLLVLIEILPDGMVERFIMPVGRSYLVFFGIAGACLLTIALLWTSLTGEMRMFQKGDKYVLTQDTDAFLFWYSVAGAAVANFVAIRLLREWFAHRRLRAAS
jgi:hypothetical protein